MKKIKFYALSLLAAVVMFGCSKYDDTELRNDVNDLKSRVEKLEAWCNTANGQISALQGLVTALENKDFITGVTPIMEGTKEVGYTITFTQSNPITILHGKDGAQGADGITPIIGVEKDADGLYYWTIKIGDTDAKWMTDSDGNKIRTTGDKGADGEDGTPGEDGKPGTDGQNGHSPVLSVDTFEGKLYWKIDDEWLLHNGNKVAVTGDKGDKGDTGVNGADGEDGDSIFAKDGIDTSDPDNVTFTLADGATKITLPRTNGITVGFDSYDVFYGTAINNEIELVFPTTLKENDYTAIMATVTNESGTGMDIQTRSSATNNVWGVRITKPTFTSGVIDAGSGKVTLTAPKNIKLSETAMLEVTITDKSGKKYTTTRPVKFFDGVIVESTAGNLSSIATDNSVTKIAIRGGMDASDFAYVRTSLTNLEVLDLSMTNMPVMYNRGLRFDGATPNLTLRRVVLPSTVTEIEEAAFANCRALETIDIENTQSIGKWAFENCYALREVDLGDKLTVINQSAFMNCKALSSIDIPSSVETLGRWLFENCDNLATITLHEGLHTLSQSTFYGCGVVSIRIPSTVTEIPAWAFQDCKSLERIYLHDRITQMGENVFGRCCSLKQVTIPKGITAIGDYMFDGCKALRDIYFHDNITTIGTGAFAGCSSLMLQGTDSDHPYNLPASLTAIGETAFQNCTSIVGVTMPPQIETLPNYLFNTCTNLAYVVLPANLKQIGDWTFGMCSSLKVIDLPASVEKMGNLAFHGCSSLFQVQCRATTPPQIESDTFGNTEPEIVANRILLIPTSVNKSVYNTWSSYFGKGIKNVL